MRLTRCFVPPPLAVGDTRLLPADVSTHVARVLRARAGQLLTLFDGRGGEYQAQHPLRSTGAACACRSTCTARSNASHRCK